MRCAARTAATRLAAVATFAALALVPLAAPAGADASQEATLLSRLNSYRASYGVGPLVVDEQVAGIARGWAAHMAATGMTHNTNLPNEIQAPWVTEGENIAMGPDLAFLYNFWENSPEHRANLLNPSFDHVGIGVFTAADGSVWGVEDFYGLGGANTAATPAQAAPPVDQSAAPADQSTDAQASQIFDTPAPSADGTATDFGTVYSTDYATGF